MNFSTRSRYALHLLLRLAEAGPDTYLTADTLAETTPVPRRSVEVVLNDLRCRRLVASKRGSRGGYVLTLPPERVSAAHVLAAMEGPIPALRSGPAGFSPLGMVGCECGRQGCALCTLSVDLTSAMNQVLTHATLARLLAVQEQAAS